MKAKEKKLVTFDYEAPIVTLQELRDDPKKSMDVMAEAVSARVTKYLNACIDKNVTPEKVEVRWLTCPPDASGAVFGGFRIVGTARLHEP